ncbi:MAG: polysaccharide lyase family 8 super-sandwich domain-containing protein, partial [Clostridia bacterium]
MTDAQTYTIIKKNIMTFFSDPHGNPEEKLAKLQPDGSFADLDYVTQNWTCWGPHQHAVRLKQFCAVYAAEKNPFYHSAKVAEAIHRGLDFLIKGKFRSDNWWMNDSGMPTQCGLIRLLFKNNLTADESAALGEIAKGNPKSPMGFRFKAPAQPDALRPYEGCGMHMMSKVRHQHIQLAIADGDAVESMNSIRDCLRALNIEFTTITYPATRSFSHIYQDEHSIKTDYSYHEHENEMVQNTYGMGVIHNMADLFVFWRGSGLALAQQATQELVNLLLDGYSLLLFRNAAPSMTLGRDAANADVRTYHWEEDIRTTFTVCEALLEQGLTYRRDEMVQFRDRVKLPMEHDHFKRTKYFWQSDLLSHNRPRYQFVVHGVSKRMKRPESILGKNIQGMFLGDGSYNLMQTSYEYDGLAPYMDWQKVPGTTVTCGSVDLNPECEIDTKIDTLRIFGGAKGTTSFVGGVSDETYGFFAMDYDHLHVTAKKAWFCFDEGVVCLGAGICTDDDHGAFTTVNQCRLCGKVLVDGAEAEPGKHEFSGCRYILSDAVGYLFLEPQKHVYLENKERTGSWSLVDNQSGTDEPVSGQVFLLGIDHGRHPENATYAYMLLPGADEHSADNLTLEV